MIKIRNLLILIVCCIGSVLIDRTYISNKQIPNLTASIDGYYFEEYEYINTDKIHLNFVFYESQKDLIKQNSVSDDTRAFSSINLAKNTCTVHLVNPLNGYMPEEMGHEMYHCLFGNWHVKQDGQYIKDQIKTKDNK